MIDFLQNLDTQWLLAINGWHSSMADAFMYTYSGKWIWVPLYAALLIMLARRYGWRNALGFLLMAVAIIAVTDQLCATVLRPLVERLRPANPANALSEAVHTVAGYRGGQYGFPSCHAANTFALSVFFALLTRSRHLTVAMLLWAALNCYSRIYLGVHYPGDILAGAFIGSGIAAVAYWAMRTYVNVPDVRGNRFTDIPVVVWLLTTVGIFIFAMFHKF